MQPTPPVSHGELLRLKQHVGLLLDPESASRYWNGLRLFLLARLTRREWDRIVDTTLRRGDPRAVAAHNRLLAAVLVNCRVPGPPNSHSPDAQHSSSSSASGSLAGMSSSAAAAAAAAAANAENRRTRSRDRPSRKFAASSATGAASAAAAAAAAAASSSSSSSSNSANQMGNSAVANGANAGGANAGGPGSGSIMMSNSLSSSSAMSLSSAAASGHSSSGMSGSGSGALSIGGRRLHHSNSSGGGGGNNNGGSSNANGNNRGITLIGDDDDDDNDDDDDDDDDDDRYDRDGSLTITISNLHDSAALSRAKRRGTTRGDGRSLAQSQLHLQPQFGFVPQILRFTSQHSGDRSRDGTDGRDHSLVPGFDYGYNNDSSITSIADGNSIVDYSDSDDFDYGIDAENRLRRTAVGPHSRPLRYYADTIMRPSITTYYDSIRPVVQSEEDAVRRRVDVIAGRHGLTGGAGPDCAALILRALEQYLKNVFTAVVSTKRTAAQYTTVLCRRRHGPGRQLALNDGVSVPIDLFPSEDDSADEHGPEFSHWAASRASSMMGGGGGVGGSSSGGGLGSGSSIGGRSPMDLSSPYVRVFSVPPAREAILDRFSGSFITPLDFFVTLELLPNLVQEDPQKYKEMLLMNA